MELDTFTVEYWNDSKFNWSEFDGGSFDSMEHATTLKLALEQADVDTDYRVATRSSTVYPIIIDIPLNMMVETE